MMPNLPFSVWPRALVRPEITTSVPGSVGDEGAGVEEGPPADEGRGAEEGPTPDEGPGAEERPGDEEKAGADEEAGSDEEAEAVAMMVRGSSDVALRG